MSITAVMLSWTEGKIKKFAGLTSQSPWISERHQLLRQGRGKLGKFRGKFVTPELNLDSGSQ